MIYEKILRPILFKINPETIHGWVIHGLGATSLFVLSRWLVQKFLFVKDERLSVKIGSLNLANPVGLAAGFDKYIIAPKAYPMVGFGFAELGSITNSPLSGNPRPRLWRIPDDHGLIVYYGLANGGADFAVKRLKNFEIHDIPYGISIAPTTGLDIKDMADDYILSLLKLHPYAEYLTLNVSCPNVSSCEKFAQVSFVLELIAKVRKVMDEQNIIKDVFVKIGPEFKDNELEQVIKCCLENRITGIVATNLVKDRSTIVPKSSAEKMNHPGGVSGELLREKSNNTIKKIFKMSRGKLKIIGVGGIFTAEDAYEKIKYGANALQVMTGWIYGGPFQIRKINLGLVSLLEKDGYKNIQEAVGKNNL